MSRAYDVSDFAAFLSKYGDSGRDRLGRAEDPFRGRSQHTRQDRNREYSLRGSEVQTLTDLGKFRMVPADDLARFGYRGDRARMEGDLGSLSRQGLIEERSIEGHSSYSTRVLTLTKDGHRLLERAGLVSNRQKVYHGLVKAKEARHDADLYRLYYKVAREIDAVGGNVRRVVLDYELKQELYRKLSRVGPNKKLAYERIRLADQYDLKVVNDKIPVPDPRSPKGPGPRFCGTVGSLPPLIVFWPRSVLLSSSAHLPVPSASYLSAAVTLAVKSPVKEAAVVLFRAGFTIRAGLGPLERAATIPPATKTIRLAIRLLSLRTEATIPSCG